jgi:serine/threonine-protein kinase
MGQVWRGEDLALHRPVAVKVLRSEYTGDPTFLARFRAEAQNAASLSHPNIAAVFDYGEVTAHDGTGETLAYLVMELVAGEPLSALLAREGALDTQTTLSVLRQTGFALGEAHRAGMVHRDVKPGNILVCPDGHVKITDFGIAWSARSVALTRTGQVIGTPQYLSPEQAEGRLATPASDVYGLGLIGYECLTGRPAFDGDNPVTIALKQVRQDPEPLPAELPRGVRTLIGRALAKDPAVRFPDGAAFVAAVEDVAAGRALPPAPHTLAVGVPRGASAFLAADDDAGTTQLAGGVVRRPAPRPRGAVAMVLLPLLGILAGAGIAVALLQALASGTPSAPAAAAEQRDEPGIVLVADDYIGRPIDDVAAQLEAYGLVVNRQPQVAPDAVPGMVTGVRPAGSELAPGSSVTVFYAQPGTEANNGGDSSGAGVTGAAVDADVEVPASVAPTTAATTSAESTAPESSVVATSSAGPTTSPTTGTSTTEDSTTTTSGASSGTTTPTTTSGTTTGSTTETTSGTSGTTSGTSGTSGTTSESGSTTTADD